MSKTVCVTGANGFVASHIVKLLLEKGYKVNGTVRDPDNEKKVGHLKKLPNAEKNLKLFKAQLLNEGDFDEATKGCDAVFHVASPFLYQIKDPQKDLIEPAQKGTQNVLNSCEKNGVKFVVQTSSGAAVFVSPPKGPDYVHTEADWSDEEFMKKFKIWYCLSKTLAEKEVWKWDKKMGDKVRVCSVSPGMVTGPSLQAANNTSTLHILGFLQPATLENSVMPYVDVRDVAKAHVLVYENEKATGRHLCFLCSKHFKDVAKVLQEACPEYKEKINLEVELKEGEKLKHPPTLDTSKIKSLGFKFDYDFKKSLQDTIASAKKKGLLK